MGVLNRAYRNISRRKIRALLVILALGFSMAILISIPAGITANQAATQNLTSNLSETIARTEASINQALTQIECSLTPSFEGFGFTTPPADAFPVGPPQGNLGNFTPGQFGGGRVPGQFGGGPFGGRGYVAMNETLYTDIESIPNVAAVIPILEVSQGENRTIEMFGRSFTRMIPNYIIEGVPLTSLVDDYPILPTNITAGRNLRAGDSGVVLLSENNTRFFNAGVGDKIEILGQTFEVVGVYGATGVSDVMTLYMNLSDAQTVTNNVGYITSLLVFASDDSRVSEVANAVSSLHPELNVVTAQQRLDQLNDLKERYTTELQNAQATLNQTQATAFQEIVVVVAATSLIVLFVMLYTVRERTKEIGTLKAIGFSNRNILSQFMLEGIMLSVVAGVVGIAIGTIAAPFLSSILVPTVNPAGNMGRVGTAAATAVTAVAVDPQLMLLTFGVSVLLGALGSLYPAWRASRTRPAEAMRYE